MSERAKRRVGGSAARGAARERRDALLKTLATPSRTRAVRDGLAVAGVIWLLYHALQALVENDIEQYWLGTPENAYSGFVLGVTGHSYTPVFTLAFAPLTGLPFPVVYVGWLVLGVAVAAWLLKPLPRDWRVVAFLLLSPELLLGNVHLLIAASVVIAIQRKSGWGWAIPVLTKVTPGIGVAWHAVRGEWRALAGAIVVTATLALISWAIAPELWGRWWEAIRANAGVAGPELAWVPLLPRLPFALALVIFAARTDRPAVLPLALVVGAPHINLTTFAMLAACPRLLRTMSVPSAHASAEVADPAQEIGARATLRAGGPADELRATTEQDEDALLA